MFQTSQGFYPLRSNSFNNLILSFSMSRPSALPVFFQEELKNKEVTEGESTTFQCKLNKAAIVEWYKGSKLLKPDRKFQLKQEGSCVELMIQGLDITDSGDYTCKCGAQKTTAKLTINGKKVYISPLNHCILKSYIF